MPWALKTHAQLERQRKKRPKRTSYRGDRDSHRFYCSAVWARMRKIIRNRDAVCVDPFGIHERTGVPGSPDQIDHVVPLREDWDRRLDPTNLRALCHSCHSKVTAQQRRQRA